MKRSKRDASSTRVAMIAVPISISSVRPSIHASAASSHTDSEVSQPPAPPHIHPDMRSLASHRRGGWNSSSPSAPAVAKVDTGLVAAGSKNRNGSSIPIGDRPIGYMAAAAAAAVNTKIAQTEPNQTTQQQHAQQIERIIIPRTGAAELLTQPMAHTVIIRSPQPPPPVDSTQQQPTSTILSPAASTTSLHTSLSSSSLASPRRRKLHLSHDASAALFTNSHHFNALAIPPPSRPIHVPTIATHTLEHSPHTQHASTERVRTHSPAATAPHSHSHNHSHSESESQLPAAATARLVYDAHNSTLRHMHPNATNEANLNPTHSATSSPPLLSPSGSVDVDVARILDSAPVELHPQPSATEKNYFPPEWSNHAHIHRPNDSNVSSQYNLHLNLPVAGGAQLNPSASAGALPFGMSPSASYASILPSARRKGDSVAHVQSSPSMPRFGGLCASSSSASFAALSGSPSASGLTLPHSHSAAAPMSDPYPAHLTVDNTSLIHSALNELIRSRGYKYRTRGRAGQLIQGERDESEGEEEETPRRRTKRGARRKNDPNRLNPNSLPNSSVNPHFDVRGYPREHWDQKGFDSLAASLPFDLLFGHEDVATKLKRKKREQRAEEERRRRDQHAESERRDNEQAHLVASDANNATTTTATNNNGSNGTIGQQRSHTNVLVPAELVGVEPHALQSHSSARPTDPLDPHTKPSLLTAAARVLLRKELYPPTPDANHVQIEVNPARALLCAPKPTAAPKHRGLHELVAAKTGLNDDADGDANGGSPAPADGDADAAIGDDTATDRTKGRARGTFLDHSKKSAKRDLKVNITAWLRVRARRHRKLLKEEDRLRAREMFDMLLIAAHGASGSGVIGGAASGSKSSRVGRPSDPSAATIELESMRRALKSLGMDATSEELAFRLQKLSAHHAAMRANAAAGISARSMPASNAGVGHTSPATSNLPPTVQLTFTDFLAVYEHISQWDELASFRQLKAQRDHAAATKAMQRKASNANLHAAHTHTHTLSHTHSHAQSQPQTQREHDASQAHTSHRAHAGSQTSRTDRAVGESAGSSIGHSSSTSSFAPSPLDGGSVGVTSSASVSGSSPASSSISLTPTIPLTLTTTTLTTTLPALSTRTDDSMRKVELPFFLWVPAAHRAERINEIVRTYGQPSMVGVGPGFEEYQKETKETDQTSKNEPTSTGRSPRIRPMKRSNLVASRFHLPGSSRRVSRPSKCGVSGDVGVSGSAAVGVDVGVSGGVGVGVDGGSSSEEDITNQPEEGGPRTIARTLVDQLNPNRNTDTQIEKDEQINNSAPLRQRKASIGGMPSSSSSSSSSKKAHHRKPSLSLSSSAVPSVKSGGAYWGSQQVLRALHYKNLSLSTSTLQTSRILTHETVAPNTAILTHPPTPLNAQQHTPTTPINNATPLQTAQTIFAVNHTPRTPRTPSSAVKRTVFVPPLHTIVPPDSIPECDLDSPTNGSAPSDSLPTSFDSTAAAAAPCGECDSDMQLQPEEDVLFGRQVSTPVRNLQRAMHAKADQTKREIEEFVKQVEAKLAGKSPEPDPNTTSEANPPSTAPLNTDDTKVVNASPLVASPAPGVGRSVGKLSVSVLGGPSDSTSPSLTRPVVRRKATRDRNKPTSATQLEQATISTQMKERIAIEKEKEKEKGRRVDPDEEKAEVMSLTDPMIKAAKSGAWEDVLMLIQTSCGDNVKLRTAYVNRRDKNGSSAIFHCAWPGHFKVLEVLLYHGADPNITNNRLNTALHLCTEKGHRKLIRLLIEMGAAIDIRNWQNKTCLDVIPVDEVDPDLHSSVVTVVPAGSSAASEPSQAAIDKAMKSHAAADASDSLKAFVCECAAEAKRKKETEKVEFGGIGTVAVTGTTGQGDFTSFAEFSSRRDAAAAASMAAHLAAATSLSLYGPDGRPAVDLWELTAADRRAAGIRGNFFGAAALQRGGQEQAKTLTGQLLIHTPDSAKGLTANQNAMGAYKASFLSLNDPLAAELRSRIVAGLIRQELAHSSLHSLWLRTQKEVSTRKSVISSTEDLMQQSGSRMAELRAAFKHANRSEQQDAAGTVAVPVSVSVPEEPNQPADRNQSVARSMSHATLPAASGSAHSNADRGGGGQTAQQ